MTYEAKWRDYRKRRNLFWAIFLTYVPGVLLIGMSLEYLFQFKTETPIYFVAIAWMIAFAISGWRLTYWKCPRCGNWFFATWLYHNQFARKCVHCGLPKWAVENSGKE